MGRIPEGPALRSLLPLVYIAWSDGTLTSDELEILAGRLRQRGEFGSDERDAFVEGWLNPADPPSPADLERLLTEIRKGGASLDGAVERPDLVELGLALAGAAGAEGAGGPAPEAGSGSERDAPAIRSALEEMVDALGVVGAEATRELLGRAVPKEPEAASEALAPLPTYEASFPVADLEAFLDGEHAELQERVFDILSDPTFSRRFDLTTPEYREQVREWLGILAAEGMGGIGYPEAYGGSGDFARAIAAFETVAHFDLSLVVKFGVQFGLFGGSILQLGTERHHDEYLARIGRGELLGCFAMTETGHGSNVRDIRTTATWDPETDQLVVHTPDVRARKDYIGNAALHGKLATVFAQLQVGNEHHGVHAVLVPIRDEYGEPLPGVAIEDCGEKEGLHGVDNGRLSFDQVRVPRGNLLDRFGTLSADGRYESEIPGRAKRFFTMLGTLVAGRISIAAASVSVARTATTIAVRYGDRRRQFGPAGEDEIPILDYLAFQRRLMPLLATTYGLHFATRDLSRRYADEAGSGSREIESLAAGLKAYGSDHSVETLQACRELTAGQGYLAENRFGRLKADADIFTTFEGANPVLYQLVARGLLTGFKEEFEEMRIWGVVRHLADRAATAATNRNPVSARRSSEEHLRDPEFHFGAFAYREERLLRSAALRIRGRIQDGVDSFHAVNQVQDHLIHLARAHVELRIFESFHHAVVRAEEKSPGIAEILGALRDLYALSRIEADRGWFLESGYMEGRKTKGVREQVNELCGRIRLDARGLVDAFAIPDVILGAPIALD